MRGKSTLKTLLLVGATLAISLGPAADSADGRNSIRLRINDAVAEPGGLVAVVIRTYAQAPAAASPPPAIRSPRSRFAVGESATIGASQPRLRAPRSTLPRCVRGSSFKNSIWRGHLYPSSARFA